MRSEDAKTVLIESYGGLAIDALAPPGESCRSGKNFVLDKLPGALTLRDGFADVYATMNDPAASYVVAGVEHCPFAVKIPAAARKTFISMHAVHSFHVSQHGGRDVRVAVVKYSHDPLRSASVKVYTYGFFARPFYDPGYTGADADGWVDEWQELSEFWDFEIYNIPNAGTGWLQLDATPATWQVGLTASRIFPTSPASGGSGTENEYYFRGWTLENLNVSRAVRYVFVLKQRLTTQVTGNEFVLEMQVDPAFLSGSAWGAGDTIRVHRNYIYNPNRFSAANDIVVAPWLLTLDDGVRYSNGLGTNKSRLWIGYESHTHNTTYAATDINCNGVVMGDANIDFAPVGIYVDQRAPGGSGGSWTADNYRFRFSVREGKNWSKLYPCSRWDGAKYDQTLQTYVAISAAQTVQFELLRMAALMSKRAMAVRIYAEAESAPGTWLQCTEVSLVNRVESVSESGATFKDAAGVTWGFRGTKSAASDLLITNCDGADARTDIGRSVDDDGKAYVSCGAAIGGKVVYADVEIAGVRYPNRVYLAPASGDGTIQKDIISVNVLTFIEFTQTGGKAIAAIGGLPDRALILTSNQAWLLSMLGELASWRVDLLTSDDGIIAPHTLVHIDQRYYWAGNHGVWSFSETEGRRLLNPLWQKTYELIAGKANSIGGFDQVNGRYVLHIPGDNTYYFPTRSAQMTVIEAMPQTLPKAVVWFSAPPEEELVLVTSDGKLGKAEGGAKDFTAEISGEFVSNNFVVGGLPNTCMLVHGFLLEYESTVPITITWYRDNDSTLFDEKVLSAANKRETRGMKLGFQCKTFRFKVTAISVVNVAPTVTIKRMIIFRTLQVAGGDNAAWA